MFSPSVGSEAEAGHVRPTEFGVGVGIYRSQWKNYKRGF